MLLMSQQMLERCWRHLFSGCPYVCAGFSLVVKFL